MGDTSIVAFLGNDFATKSNKCLGRIQVTTIAAVGPLSTVWSYLVKQDMVKGSNTLVPVEDVIDTIKRTFSLLRSSVSYISQARRDLIISQLEFKKKGLANVMQEGVPA